jgi:hypothetical protein
LTSARARISALEAELRASQQAWESATAAKVSAEEAIKAAEAKAKKAKKALSDAEQKRLQREWSIAERVDSILVAVGSKYCAVSSWFIYSSLLLLIAIYFFRSFLYGVAEKIGESWKLRQPNAKDPLMALVDLLESNWKLVHDVLRLTRHVLVCIFVRFWPKKRGEMPCDNLKKLLEAFDTVEDPVLTLKCTLVKCGVEGAIALAQSHGKEVDWAKIGSSPARPLSEMLGFFKYANKYAPNIVSLITPSTTSSTSAPISLTPPPSATAAEPSAPSPATEPAAEVA